MAAILLVEDDSALRYAMEVNLVRSGYSVIAVPDTMAAIDVLERDVELALLITDLIMPGGMPHEFALIRMALVKRPGLPVIALTGHPEMAHLEPELPAKLLIKPVSAEMLLEAVRQALATPRGEVSTSGSALGLGSVRLD